MNPVSYKDIGSSNRITDNYHPLACFSLLYIGAGCAPTENTASNALIVASSLLVLPGEPQDSALFRRPAAPFFEHFRA